MSRSVGFSEVEVFFFCCSGFGFCEGVGRERGGRKDVRKKGRKEGRKGGVGLNGGWRGRGFGL